MGSRLRKAMRRPGPFVPRAPVPGCARSYLINGASTSHIHVYRDNLEAERSRRLSLPFCVNLT